MIKRSWTFSVIATGLLAGCVMAQQITVAIRDHETGAPMENVKVDQYRTSGLLTLLNPGYVGETLVSSKQTNKEGIVMFEKNPRAGTYQVSSNTRSPFLFEVNGKGVVVKPPQGYAGNAVNTFHIPYRDNGKRFLEEVIFCERGSDERTAYIGTYTGDGGSKGIYRVRVNERTGAISAPELVAEVDNPSFLALNDKSKKYLYAVSESSNKVFAYALGNEDGMLKLLNEAETGAGPCHVACYWTTSDDWSKMLAVANYGDGSVNTWRLENDGRIGRQTAFFQNNHTSKATGRQQSPHAHGAVFTSVGVMGLVVPDLGADRVYMYHHGPSSFYPFKTTPWIELPPGRGPRHAIGTVSHLYILNELSNTISVYKYHFNSSEKPHLFTFIEEVSTLPEGFDGQSAAAELIIGNWQLYASNRGHDSIARFQIEKDGRLKLMECTPCGGKGPRHFTIMPDGRWMLVANQDSNNIALFRIGQNGVLTHIPEGGVDIASPTCVIFEWKKSQW